MTKDKDDEERGGKNDCRAKHDCKGMRKRKVRQKFVDKMNQMKKGGVKPPIEDEDDSEGTDMTGLPMRSK